MIMRTTAASLMDAAGSGLWTWRMRETDRTDDFVVENG